MLLLDVGLIFIISLSGIGITMQLVVEKFRKELIERGYAEYDQRTGKWKYKDSVQIVIYKEEKTKTVESPKKEESAPMPEEVKEDSAEEDGLALIPFVLAKAKPTNIK
jgi:hypothetical protein